MPRGFIADLLARRGDEVIVVEGKRRFDARTLEQLQSIKHEVEQHPNWRFRLVAPPTTFEQPPPEPNFDGLIERIDWARKMLTEHQPKAAIAVLWMAIEACQWRLVVIYEGEANRNVNGLALA